MPHQSRDNISFQKIARIKYLGNQPTYIYVSEFLLMRNSKEMRPATEGQTAICVFVTQYMSVIRDEISATYVAALGRDHAGLSSFF